jgi:hypothetical protein
MLASRLPRLPTICCKERGKESHFHLREMFLQGCPVLVSPHFGETGRGF